MNKPQLIIFGAIGVVVLLAILIVTGTLPGLKPRTPAPYTITVWGPRDPPELWVTLAQRYRDEGMSSAVITYVKRDPNTYRADLLQALASGRGPDAFLLTDAEVQAYRDTIAPLPDGALGYEHRNLRGSFADGAVAIITDASGALLATPLDLDTLALFFNRDAFNAANIPTPPQTWEELVSDVTTLTKLSSVGGIERSGVALGTVANVSHAADILSTLIYQSGGGFLNAAGTRSTLASPATTQSLLFYTSFADTTKKTYSWNAFFKPSLDAFADGETAMAIGYAADVPRIAARNPQLNFDVALLPQPKGALTPASLGRLHILVVSRTSAHVKEAWSFLLWLQGRAIQKSYTDALGLPSARRDLIAERPPVDYLQPFYDQVLSARTLPLALSGSLGGILGDMIDAVISRRLTIEQAIARAANAITEQVSQPHE